MDRICVIGIGYRPLGSEAREALLASEVVLANDRLLEIFKGYVDYPAVKGRMKIVNGAAETANYISAYMGRGDTGGYNITVLADGDPLFFGIGRVLIERFGKEGMEIYPDLSSMQVAFSRIKEPWNMAFLMSVHGGPDPCKRRKLEHEVAELPGLLAQHSRIGILTDRDNNPAVIAQTLTKANTSCRVYVCERLGYKDERIVQGRPEEIAGMSFSRPNVVILVGLDEQSP